MLLPSRTGPGGTSREMTALVMMAFALLAVLGATMAFRSTGGRGGDEGIPEAPEFGPLEHFERLERLDVNFLEDNTWDWTQLARGIDREFRQEAHDLISDYKAILHALQYLRTLAKKAAEPAGGWEFVTPQKYMEMITLPHRMRGQPVRMRGRLFRYHKNLAVPEGAEAAAAGATTLSCLYFNDMDRLRPPYARSGTADELEKKFMWHLVVSPYDLRPYMRKQVRLIEIRGVFLRRWPPNAESDYWLPVIVALQPEEIELPAGSTGYVLSALLAAVVFGIVIVVWLGQRQRGIRRPRKRAAAKPGQADKPGASGGSPAAAAPAAKETGEPPAATTEPPAGTHDDANGKKGDG